MKLVKEIRSKSGELHFKRWSILSTPWCNIYLHAIYLPDYDDQLHDHPWNFISVILRGGYLEWTRYDTAIRKPFSFAYKRAEEVHTVKSLLSSPTWTLCLTGARRRQWGYDCGKLGWVDHETYRRAKNK